MCLLTFSFYMLSEHPYIQKRLRQEIYDIVGQTGRPTYDQMREMKYMRAFLNGIYSELFFEWNFSRAFAVEVLRLYPPVLVSFSFFPWSQIYLNVCVAVRLIAGMDIGYFWLSPWSHNNTGLQTKRSFFLPQAAAAHQSMSQHKQSLVILFFLDPHTDGNNFRCIYSVLIMHRRTDLWGPDGMITILTSKMWFIDPFDLQKFQPSYSILIASWMIDCTNT